MKMPTGVARKSLFISALFAILLFSTSSSVNAQSWGDWEGSHHDFHRHFDRWWMNHDQGDHQGNNSNSSGNSNGGGTAAAGNGGSTGSASGSSSSPGSGGITASSGSNSGSGGTTTISGNSSSGSNTVSGQNCYTTVHGDVICTRDTGTGGISIASSGDSSANTGSGSTGSSSGSTATSTGSAGSGTSTGTGSGTGTSIGTGTGTDNGTGTSGVTTASCSAAPTLVSAFYVSPSGSDSNNGTTASTPFATLAQAQKAMQGSSIKTTYLMGGTYQLSSTLALSDKDSGESWLAYPGQTPILDGGNKVSPGITITGNTGTSKISVRGITLRNVPGDGIDIWNTSSDIVDSNTIYNISKNGIVIMGDSTGINLTHNLIYDIAQHAIQAGNDPSNNSNHNILIDSNYIHDVNTQSGLSDTGAIYFDDRAHAESGIVISNNEIQNFGQSVSGNGARAIYLDDESSNVNVANNFVTGAGAFAFQVHGGDHVVFTGNFFDTTGITAEPFLYEDDVASGFPNYGMAGNSFVQNTVYLACGQTAKWSELWRLDDSTGGQIARPGNTGNTYVNISAQTVNDSSMVETAPVYQSNCAAATTLAPPKITPPVGPQAPYNCSAP
jgi:hypothetical protein